MSKKNTPSRPRSTPLPTSELARSLGRRLRYLRAQKGVTQAELSGRAATGRAHLSKLERGRILPRYSTLARLAACLGVDVGELVRVQAGSPGDSSSRNS
jgi:transcriptional regulator with XRE-family HTH domain